MLTTVLFLTFASLSGADMGLTIACITDGRCVETNPLLRPLSDRPGTLGAVKMATTTGIIMGLSSWHPSKRWHKWIALGILVTVEGAIVSHNVRQLRR